MASRTTHRLLLLAAAGLFSTAGAAIKATTFTAWQIASFRSLIAALFVWLVVPAARRGFTWRVLPVALAYALTLDLFVAGTKLTTAANAIFLQSTAPLYVLLFSPILLKERLHQKDFMRIIVVAIGLVLFFLSGDEQRQASAPDPVTGNILSACSGLAYAFALMGLRWIGQHQSTGNPLVMVIAVGNILAALLCLPNALPIGQARPIDWGVVLFLGIFQIGLGYICLTAGLRHIPAVEASTVLLVEPVLNALLTWLLHGERMAPMAMLGGALIVGATLGDIWWSSRLAAQQRLQQQREAI